MAEIYQAQTLSNLSEEAIFEIKQKFLREIPHPKLIQKQINRLKEFELEGMMRINYELDQHSDLIDFFKQYIAALMTLKLNISNANDGVVLFRHLCNLKNLQETFIKNLTLYHPENCSGDDSEIKQSDPFDAYTYLKELQVQNVQENEIKHYLCTQFEQAPESYSELAKAVLRAKKIGLE